MSRLYLPTQPPIILAHRGGGLEYPENSRTAFDAMCEAGFRYIETDAQATRDGVAVIFHDSSLDRASDGTGIISEKTWQNIRDVHTRDNSRIMRLDEALRDFPEIIFNIDIKSENALKPVIEAIEQTRAYDRVCLASFSSRRLHNVRKHLPSVATSIGVSESIVLRTASILPDFLSRGTPFLRFTRTHNVQAVQVPLRTHGIPIVTPRFIDFVHSHSLAIHVWTVNDTDTALRLRDWGVDGVVTDRPQAIRRALST